MIKSFVLIFTLVFNLSLFAQDTVTEIPLTQDEIDALLNSTPPAEDPTTSSDNNMNSEVVDILDENESEVSQIDSDSNEVTSVENDDSAISDTTTTIVTAVSEALTIKSIYEDYKLNQRLSTSIKGLYKRTGREGARARSTSFTKSNIEKLETAQKKRSLTTKLKGIAGGAIAIGGLGYLYLSFDLSESGETPNCNNLNNAEETVIVDQETLDLIDTLQVD